MSKDIHPMTLERHRSRYGALVHAVAAIWLVALAAPAQAQGTRAVREKRSQAEVATVRGTLEVYRLDFEDGGHTNQLSLAGKVLFEEPAYESLSITASYPEPGPARVVLLELSSGGTGCPSFYKVIELKDDGSAVRSKKFGNCSPLAQPSFTDGALLINIPKIGGAAAQSWRYQNGKLSKAAPPPRPRGK
ncbi:hypothetical protein [Archangium sp.]|uniref:hypothetical protein n=1 Tax=Archangium sp. TaxID=1872627 RepID=UPI00389A286A